MRLGIFSKTFVRPTIEQTLGAVKSHGLNCVQFNMSCAGTDPMPETIEPRLCDRIRGACDERGITIAAISGTFNMIHRDRQRIATGLKRLGVIAQACAAIGAPLITLCTGSRDPENMWRGHPDNDSPAAWSDLCKSMRGALAIAESHGVALGVEPEVSNVVSNARLARRLLDEMRAPRHLKIIIDAANLFPAGTLPQMREILREAFDLLGSDIAIAHAKDLVHDGEAGDCAAGTGVLDYDLYLSLLDQCGFKGPVILHGLKESEVAGSVAFVRSRIAARDQGGSR